MRSPLSTPVLALGFLALVPLALSNPANAQTPPQSPIGNLAPTPSFFFHDGDRVVILGDSITEQRLYSTLLESYTLSRFPNWKITFRNQGWSSDRADLRMHGGQETGFKRDILPLNPTAITIDFGMNDGTAGETGLKSYLDNSRALADTFTRNGARVAFLTSSPVERSEPNQPAGGVYNVGLRQYSEGLKTVATEKGTFFVDQLTPMINLIDAGRAAGVLGVTSDGPRLSRDGIHPNWAGHLIMATSILKGLNAPPLVSRVELDAAKGQPGQERLLGVQGARVSSVMRAQPRITPQGIEKPVGKFTVNSPFYFTRTDEALPWPVSPDAALALKIPGFTPFDDLSRYDLKVMNLPQAKYQIAIDDVPVGTYTREQLAAGVNLSDAPGPIYDQQQALLKKIIEKNTTFYNRWRQVQLAQVPSWVPGDIEAARANELARLDAQVAAQEKEIDALRQPKMHIWSLKAVN